MEVVFRLMLMLMLMMVMRVLSVERIVELVMTNKRFIFCKELINGRKDLGRVEKIWVTFYSNIDVI